MENCPICRASLNGASTCRRCRADLERVQEVEGLGEQLRGRAMLSLAAGDTVVAGRWLRRARTIHITPELLALERFVMAVLSGRHLDGECADKTGEEEMARGHHGEGSATHAGPEPCGVFHEGGDDA
jgi:hypothetical protein